MGTHRTLLPKPSRRGRKIYDVHHATMAPLTAETRIGRLFDLEREINRLTASRATAAQLHRDLQ
jgi:hypothetical protein